MFIKMDIRELIILEKRISQISSKIEVVFGFDVIKTSHAEDRSDFSKRGISGPNQNHISNAEMSEFVSYFKNDISQGIATGDIVDQTQFVIRSFDRELAMAIIASRVEDTYWKLIIKTVFRVSEENPFKVGLDQLLYDK
jgi:hypothetical protein